MYFEGGYIVQLILPRELYRWVVDSCDGKQSAQTFIIKQLEQIMNNQSYNSRQNKDYNDGKYEPDRTDN